MTRKDREAIAAIIDGLRDKQYQYPVGHIIEDDLIDALADYMASDNPDFDRDLFVKACYGEK